MQNGRFSALLYDLHILHPLLVTDFLIGRDVLDVSERPDRNRKKHVTRQKWPLEQSADFL